MDTTRESSTAFDGTPHAPAAARRFVRQVLGEWRLSHLAEDAVLLTSELVTNAVVHAGTGIELTCRLDADATPPKLEIEVDDHQPERQVLGGTPPLVDPLPTSGRGLALAGMLADAWGVTYTRTAKRVWVRMEFADVPESPAACLPAPRRPIDRLQVAVVVADAEGRVVSWNSDAESLLGWTAEQVAGSRSGGAGRLARARAVRLVAGRDARPGTLARRDADAAPGRQVGPRLHLPPAHRRAGRATAGRSGWWPTASTASSSPRRPRRSGGRRAGGSRTCSTRTGRSPSCSTPSRGSSSCPAAATRRTCCCAADGGNRFGVAAGAGATAGLVGVLSSCAFNLQCETPVLVDDLLAVDVELAQRLEARSLACAPLMVAGEVSAISR